MQFTVSRDPLQWDTMSGTVAMARAEKFATALRAALKARGERGTVKIAPSPSERVRTSFTDECITSIGQHERERAKAVLALAQELLDDDE